MRSCALFPAVMAILFLLLVATPDGVESNPTASCKCVHEPR